MPYPLVNPVRLTVDSIKRKRFPNSLFKASKAASAMVNLIVLPNARLAVQIHNDFLRLT